MMAASLKPLRFEETLKARLNGLGCPLTEDIDASLLTELFCKPGQSRISLLYWLFTRLDPSLKKILDSSGNNEESCIKSLLFVASMLGLCEPDDIDLIRGVTAASKQTMFFEMLLNLISVVHSADESQTATMNTSGSISIKDEVAKGFHFMNMLLSNYRVDDIFSTKVALLPPDIQRQIDISMSKKGFIPNKSPLPSLQSLKEMANKLVETLETENQKLEQLKDEFPYHGADPSGETRVCKILHLVLTELAQLVDHFTYHFKNEMEFSCNRPLPTLLDVGPKMKQVHTLLLNFNSLLQSFETTRNSSEKVKLHIENFKRLPKKAGSLANICDSALVSYEECLKVLDGSLHKRTLE